LKEKKTLERCRRDQKGSKSKGKEELDISNSSYEYSIHDIQIQGSGDGIEWHDQRPCGSNQRRWDY